MDTDISTCTGKILRYGLFEIGDHQVAIKTLAMWPHTLYDTSSKAVRHKWHHDIDMGIVSSSWLSVLIHFQNQHNPRSKLRVQFSLFSSLQCLLFWHFSETFLQVSRRFQFHLEIASILNGKAQFPQRLVSPHKRAMRIGYRYRNLQEQLTSAISGKA